MNIIYFNKKDNLSSVEKKFNITKFKLGILFEKKKIIGIITLGDLRRILGKTNNRKTNIFSFVNKSFISIDEKYPKSEYTNRINNILIRKRKQFPDFIIVKTKENYLKEIISKEDLKEKIIYKKICVIGLGQIGLPLSVVLANNKLNVIGFDKDKQKIIKLKKNSIPFYEENLKDLFLNVRKQKSLELTSSFKFNAQIYIVCIGTQIINKKNNIQNLLNLLETVLKKIFIGDLICIRGTTSLGDMQKIYSFIKTRTKLEIGKEIFLTYCPERLIEGKAIEEIKSVPQVISGYSERCINKIKELWLKINTNITIVEKFSMAEMIKLSSNSYRDLIFAFSNELCRIARNNNIDIYDLIEKANYAYPRNNFALPSPGVGGSCLVKDPYMFTSSSGYKLGKLSRKINENSIKILEKKIIKLNISKFSGKAKILIFGLTFKGDPVNTDTRDSTSLSLLTNLRKKFYVKGYDISLKKYNLIDKNLSKIFVKEKDINKFDIIVVANNHKENIDYLIKKIKKNNQKKRYIIDCWKLADKSVFKIFNYEYRNLSTI